MHREVLFGCLAAFMAIGAWAWAWPELDHAVGNQVQHHLDAAHQAHWRRVSSPGATVVSLVVAVASASVLVWQRDSRAATVTVVAAVASALGVTLIKELTQRERPSLLAAGYAFPSGHTASATVTGGLLALVVLPRLARRKPKLTALQPLVCGIWIGLALVVGIARVLGGLHWPTDVLAGWAWGGAVLSAALLWLGRDDATAEALRTP